MSVYILDEFQLADLQEAVKAAKTLEELKDAILQLLKALPTEYQ